ncbi:MAG: alkaline phosphatase family protein [Verrucomicrobiales bacterium]|nr:alkaline phosphatase family protein [Verrucomicrobiales bacterium]
MSKNSPPTPRTAILNVVGLTPRHIGPDTPFLREFSKRDGNQLVHIKPTLPGVTSSMQATFLTGKPPGEHGIVANMWYDRAYSEHRCWKQSNHLVQGRKIWEHIRDEHNPDFTCAKVFWWNNMYSTADYQITPRPIYCANGKKVFDIQTWPMDLRKKIKRKIGKFPFPAFWGPAAGIASSDWIAKSAKWFEDRFSPDLNLVYLPHLDYNLQRLGPEASEISEDLQAIDAVVCDLVTHLESRGVSVLILSEYGITQVDRPIHLNRLFREKGWLSWRKELKREVLDPGNCQVFAIPDHQVAHIYLNNPAISEEVVELLRGVEGITDVYTRDELAGIGLDHERSGDLVAVSDERSWFTYYYWKSDRKAPDFARCVDIHRKPGYDPVELFLDPKIWFPKLKIAGKLLRKMLGFRMLMDVIPLDADLVKGSHGCIPKDPDDHPVLMGPLSRAESDSTVEATEVYSLLLQHCLRKGNNDNERQSP